MRTRERNSFFDVLALLIIIQAYFQFVNNVWIGILNTIILMEIEKTKFIQVSNIAEKCITHSILQFHFYQDILKWVWSPCALNHLPISWIIDLLRSCILGLEIAGRYRFAIYRIWKIYKFFLYNDIIAININIILNNNQYARCPNFLSYLFRELTTWNIFHHHDDQIKLRMFRLRV